MSISFFISNKKGHASMTFFVLIINILDFVDLLMLGWHLSQIAESVIYTFQTYDQFLLDVS